MSKAKQALKKSLALSLSLILVLILGTSAIPQQALAVDTNITADFTDPNFLAAVRDILDIPSGNIYLSNVVDVIQLDVRNRNITNLAGIQHFSNLKILDASSNQLSSLDVSAFNLEGLSASHNNITTAGLVLGNQPSLVLLDLNSNQLTTLDVSAFTALIMLYAENNRLTSIQLGNLTNLEYLELNLNNLVSLDVSALTALRFLAASSSNLTSLTLGNLNYLEHIEIFNNRLTTLNVAGTPQLRALFVEQNYFASIDMLVGLSETSIPANSIDNCVHDGDMTFEISWLTKFTARIYGLRFSPQNSLATDDSANDTEDDSISDLLDDALRTGAPIVLPPGASAEITVDDLESIRDSDAGEVDIVLPCGRQITISNIGDNPRAIDLNLEVTIVPPGSPTRIGNVNVGANSIVIDPAASGQFGFTITLTIPAAQFTAAGVNANNVQLFLVDSEGRASRQGQVRLNNDGSASISISRASFYVLTETNLVGVEGAYTLYTPTPYVATVAHDVPQTGITGRMILPLVLGLLGFALVAVTIGHRIYVSKKDKS